MAVTLSEVFGFKAPHHPVVLGPTKEYGKIPDDENHTKSVPNLIHGRKHRELIAKKKAKPNPPNRSTCTHKNAQHTKLKLSLAQARRSILRKKFTNPLFIS